MHDFRPVFAGVEISADRLPVTEIRVYAHFRCDVNVARNTAHDPSSPRRRDIAAGRRLKSLWSCLAA